MSEYEQIIKEYPNIDFVGNKPSKDRSLFLLEAPNIAPQNYFKYHIQKYKRVYTWSSKWYDEYKKLGLDVVKVPNFPLFDNYYKLDSYLSWSSKEGICLICRYREKQYCDFDISYKRIEVFESLEGITKHCYGKIPYCGEHYKGVIGEGKGSYPSSKEKLNVLDRYRFNLCFENAYDPVFSWDYITEKITDCFKAGTIPVYYGCYNIEERIPKEAYIDYREYEDPKELVKKLNSMSVSELCKMSSVGSEWYKESPIGDIEELKNLLWYAENDICVYFDGGVCCHDKFEGGEASQTHCDDVCKEKRTL